jgi:hypothetical protein
MKIPAKRLYPRSFAEEVWIAFDCCGPGAKNRLHRERKTWGAAATIENLRYGRAVLVVRPGGTKGLAR